MYDPEANYVYGVAARRMGRLVDAKETLGWAARSPQFKAVALVQSAEIAILEKDLDRAAEYAFKALVADDLNVNALEVLAVAHRLAGRKAEVDRVLGWLLEVDPLDHLARFERYLRGRKPEDLEACRALIRNELPHETWLEMAAFYARLGLDADAAEALKAAPAQTTVLYTLAYLLRESAPAESAACLEKASAASPHPRLPLPRGGDRRLFLGPGRPAGRLEAQVLPRPHPLGQGPARRGPGSLRDGARAPTSRPSIIARGAFFERTDAARAAADYAKAIELDGSSWRARHTLTAFHLRQGRPRRALAAARKAAADFPAEAPLQVDLAEALLAAGDPHEAATVLDAVAALPYEGASDIYGLYVRAHVGIGLDAMKNRAWAEAVQALELAKLYPEKLGTGAPFHADSRMQDYLIALCYDKLGEKAKAADLRESIRDYTLKYWDEAQPYGYYGGLVLEKLGRKEDRLKARELLGPAQAAGRRPGRPHLR